MSSDPEAPSPKPRKRRRWLRYTLWTLLGLIVLAALFHRPLLVLVVEYAGGRVATSQGLELEWDVKGSILGDVSISNFKTKGTGEKPWLKRADVQEFAIDYDLKSMWKRDYDNAVERLKLHQGVV